MRSGLGWLVALGLAGSAMAATPTVGVILPRGLQRGTEREVSFNGARLTDAAQVLFYSPGLSVVDLKVVNDNQVKVKLKAAPDCALGEHVVRLVAKSGMSELRTVYVGPYPQVEEKEPNSEFVKPQPIQTGRTVEGRVDNEDVDYFSLTAKKGERLAIEIEGMRLGVTIFDPCISILNSKRFTLATSDDNILMNQDGACSIVAPEDGTYVIEVRETSYRGDGNCHYRLHVGSHPRPAAVYPLGGKVGESVNFQFLGDPRGDFQQAVALPKVAKTKFPIFPQQADGVAPSGNSVRVSEFANVLEAEPNDEVGKASKGDMTLPVAFNGVISKNGDVDFFRFKATQGQVFDVACFARQLRSPLDPVIHLHYGDGRYIAGNDDAIGPDSYLRFQAPATGEFALQVHDHLRKGGPDYVYRVEF